MFPNFNEMIRQLFSQSPRKRPGKNRPESRKPTLEFLEERCVLAPILYVDADALSSSGDGSSWANACKTLQSALEIASNSSNNITEIWIADGVYTPTQRTSSQEARSESFTLINGVSLYGGFQGNESSKSQRAKNSADGTYVYQTVLSGDLFGNDNPGDAKTLDDNAYTVLTGSGISSSIVVEGLIVSSGNASLSTVPNGSLATSWTNGGGIYLSNSNGVSLENLIITNNSASLAGGGIYISGGSTTIVGCTFRNNAAGSSGGGIHLVSGTLNLQSSNLSDNFADAVGGGGIAQIAGTLNVSSTLLSGNIGHYGGGLYQGGNASGTIVDSSFISNVALDRYAIYGEGGGIYQAGQLDLTNITFALNTAGYGGAISTINPDAPTDKPFSTYTNLTLSKNVASESGGGLYMHSGRIRMNNTILAGNTASVNPDVFGERDPMGTSKPTLVLTGSNNLIGNGAGLPENYSPTTYPNIENGRNGNVVGSSTSTINPQLGAPTDFGNGILVLPLLSNSPALDAGDSSKVPAGITTDARGQARISGSAVDIGAVEGSSTARTGRTYVVDSLENIVDPNDGVLTFREAFEAANRNIQVGNAEAGSFTETDVIRFAEGLSGTITLNGKTLTVHDSLTITGSGMELLNFDAENQSQVFKTVGRIGVNLSGFTMLNGYSSTNGGAMSVYSSTVNLNKIAIRDSNTASQGYGGGFYVKNGATTNCTDIVISGCSAMYGGGFYQSNTRTNLVGVSFYDNFAREDGGGFYQTGGNSFISNATIARNSANLGAGLGFLNASSSITQLTATRNLGVYIGGILVGQSSRVDLRNSIVADNFSYSTPDIFVFQETGTEKATLQGSYTLLGNGTGQQSLLNGVDGNKVGTTANPLDPKFASPSLYNGQLIYPLTVDSPAIDAANRNDAIGLNGVSLTLDVRGVGYPRVVGSQVDMGSCEFQTTLQAGISVDTTVLRLGQELLLTGENRNGSPTQVEFLWDLNNNGYYGELTETLQGLETGRTTTFYSAETDRVPGEPYKVRLIIKDSLGQMSEPFELDLSILTQAPTYSISGPSTFEVKTAQEWTITATNTALDPIMAWEVDWGDDTTTTILGGPKNSIEVFHYYRMPGIYKITIRTESLFKDQRTYKITDFQVIAAQGSAVFNSELANLASIFTEEILSPSVESSPASQPSPVSQSQFSGESSLVPQDVALLSLLAPGSQFEAVDSPDLATLALYDGADREEELYWSRFEEREFAESFGFLFDDF